MGKRMKLIDVVKNIDNYDDEMTIYAARPWSATSEAVVEYETSDGKPPETANKLELGYFLEVFLVKEFIEGWNENNSVHIDHESVCKRVIEYAINDA
ncbi:hypothetical protein DET61_11919 [Marinobacter nauticus]|uniref:Uncharacterized protein n=2 Tax=Marinobacter nauticus TaxID=2743 RepID=A0A368X5F9_MARNT|nr:hypothetical protein DET61_11919 [Marinobacter nauticus]